MIPLPEGWVVRPNTWDAAIFDCVVNHNEYGLPERFTNEDRIIDVGCHIGAFGWACLERGAGSVHGYDPNAESLGLAANNLGTKYPHQVVLRLGAVWRSDRVQEALSYRPHQKPENTGGGDVVHGEGPLVLATCPLDEVIDRCGGSIRLLKLDCEGSEYPIVYTATRLHCVQEVVGEYHLFDDLGERYVDLPPFTGEALAEFLLAQGFREVTSSRNKNDETLGRFRAVR